MKSAGCANALKAAGIKTTLPQKLLPLLLKQIKHWRIQYVNGIAINPMLIEV
jgi:hypothetical protein